MLLSCRNAELSPGSMIPTAWSHRPVLLLENVASHERIKRSWLARPRIEGPEPITLSLGGHIMYDTNDRFVA